jgi:hypothetical protein
MRGIFDMPVTRADLDGWRDQTARLSHMPPSDPDDHSCMYHGRDASVPVTVQITTTVHMVRYACRPCGESILAVLHGTPCTDVPRPDAALQAAKLSISMAKMLGEHRATVTQLRPRDDSDHAS